jgi:hypothetical protein
MSAALARAAAHPKALRVALIVAVLGALPAPVATADAAEPCPNEQLRQESNSTQLPDCRAYELVSPGDAGGGVNDVPLDAPLKAAVKPSGALAARLQSALEVQAEGSAVFWESGATPPSTGSIPDGGSQTVFESTRTSDGWTTSNLTPFVAPSAYTPNKLLVGASTDGSIALVATTLALNPSAFADPPQAEGDDLNAETVFLYRITQGGAAPEMVSRGEALIPPYEDLPQSSFSAYSASADLNEITFASSLPLEQSDRCNGGEHQQTTYIWNRYSGAFAHTIGSGSECGGILYSAVPAVLPNGALVLSTPANELVVETSPTRFAGTGSVMPLTGSAGGALLTVTPDGSAAYVQSEGGLTPGATTANNIYAMSMAEGIRGAVTCVSCSTAGGGPDQSEVHYLTASQNGECVLFTTDQGLWLWRMSGGARLLAPVHDVGPDDAIISENGQHIVVLTTAALSSADTNGAPDLYELSAGQEPTLLTAQPAGPSYRLYESNEALPGVTGYGATAVGSHVVGAVSNSGLRVVYGESDPASPQTVREWDDGQPSQLSPQSASSPYIVQSISGPELEDVFFLSDQALVGQDDNGGALDVYDARSDGGFPTPSAPADQSETPDPSAPAPMPYTANLTPPSTQLAALHVDTSHPPASKGTAKSKTCKRGLVQTRGKCVKRKSKKAKGRKAKKKLGVRG